MAAHPKEPTLLHTTLLKAKKVFFYAGLFSLCSNILMLSLPLYSLQVLDRVMSSRSVETLTLLTVIVVTLLLFYGFFGLIRSLILSRLGEWLDVTLGPLLLSCAISRSALGLPTSASQHQRDLLILKNFINGSGLTTLMDAPWSIIFTLVIYMISPVLGFITVLASVVLLGLAMITEFATKRTLDRAQRISIQSMGTAETASRNAEVVEAMGMLNQVTDNWQEQNKKSLEFHTIANNRANLLLTVSRVLRMVLQIAITGVGGLLALKSELSVGGMIASSILTGRALAPFEAAIGVWKNFVDVRDAYQRLDNSISQTPQLRGTMPLPAPTGRLSAEGLFFRPVGSEKPIIKGVTFQLAAGESLGIIGPSAAGKSTLAKLLIGILPPTHGTARLDGVEVFKWNREDLGPHVGYLPQDVELFSGSVKDNIARMNPNADPEDIIQAAKLAGVHEMILRLPQGYETQFNSFSVSLSPGQRQRIGLARAMFGNPRFIVLDEPNSNLDSEGEKALIEAIGIMKDRGITVVVVAHRPSIVANIDKILMLRDGVIEQFGPRQQILQKYTAPAALTSAAS